MNINLKHKENLSHEILALNWNIKSNEIVLVSKNNNQIILEKRAPDNWELMEKASIPLLENVQSIEADENSDKILVVSKNTAIVFTWHSKKVEHIIHREEGFLSGGFIDYLSVYLTIPASSGSVDWGIWNLEEERFNEFELERYRHYGRGAIIHPSKKLIGSCWSAYESGFLLHLAKPENNRLLYFEFEDQSCKRSEYEAYAPSFSFKGDKIAFVVNPYIGSQENIETLCVYNIVEQNVPLIEVDLEDYKNESVTKTYFLGNDEYIILKNNRGIDLIKISAPTFKKRILDSPAKILLVNPINNQFLIVAETEVIIFSIGGIPENEFGKIYDPSIEVANNFIAKFSTNLKIAGDVEVIINSLTDYLNEIPTVFVKFGYERAKYRLDNKDILFEKLSPETKTVVNKWFEENQQKELAIWKNNNSKKEKIILKDKKGCEIEIFIGKHTVETNPNFRIYYNNSKWIINPDDQGELAQLPELIREDIELWMVNNYERIIKPWSNANE